MWSAGPVGKPYVVDATRKLGEPSTTKPQQKWWDILQNQMVSRISCINEVIIIATLFWNSHAV